MSDRTMRYDCIKKVAILQAIKAGRIYCDKKLMQMAVPTVIRYNLSPYRKFAKITNDSPHDFKCRIICDFSKLTNGFSWLFALSR